MTLATLDLTLTSLISWDRIIWLCLHVSLPPFIMNIIPLLRSSTLIHSGSPRLIKFFTPPPSLLKYKWHPGLLSGKMLRRYSVRLCIYSWFIKYLPPQLASVGALNKFASARNSAVVFYPGVYRGVIYISTRKAVNEEIWTSWWTLSRLDILLH